MTSLHLARTSCARSSALSTDRPLDPRDLLWYFAWRLSAFHAGMRKSPPVSVDKMSTGRLAGKNAVEEVQLGTGAAVLISEAPEARPFAAARLPYQCR